MEGGSVHPPDAEAQLRRSILVNLLFSLVVLGGCALAAELALRGLHHLKQRSLETLSEGVGEAPRTGTTLLLVGSGGSTMLGEPYAPKLDIMQVVRHYLAKGYAGEVRVELLADGGRTLEFLYPLILEKLAKRPSLFVLLSGHNEFLGNFGHTQRCTPARARLYAALHSSRLFSLFDARVQRFTLHKLPRVSDRTFFDVPVVCEAQWRDTMDRYRRHILALAEYSADHGIPAVFVMPASNEADFDPHRSVYRGLPERRDELERLYACGRWLMLRDRFEEAVSPLRAARAIDPGFAASTYQLGRALLALGRSEEAEALFEAAKEADGFPWRALNAQLEAIRTAGERHGVTVVDAREVLRRTSPNGSLGKEVFHDIHHPALNGYHAIAREIVARAVGARLLPGLPEDAPAWETDTAIRERFDFAPGDWFYAFYTRAKWMNAVRGMTFDPVDRIALMLAYLDAAERIDPAYFASHIDGDGLLERARADHRAALARWSGKSCRPKAGEPAVEPYHATPRNDSTRLAAALLDTWGVAPRDAAPITLSGIPSLIRHCHRVCANGIDPLGRPIAVAGERYESGFGAQPRKKLPSEIAFRLDSTRREFSASIAVSDGGSEKSSGRCEVVGDGRVLARSEELRWKRAPQRIEADVSGVRELRLRCFGEENRNLDDAFVWLDPELSR